MCGEIFSDNIITNFFCLILFVKGLKIGNYLIKL